MKIILKALGVLKSEIMNVPEETGYQFRLALQQSAQVFHEGPSREGFPTVCVFEWTGEYTFKDVRVYYLIDIQKL